MTTGQSIDDTEDLREQQEFYDEVGKCANSIGETLRLTAVGTKTTTTRGAKIRFGRNCWIYSTSIEPTIEERSPQPPVLLHALHAADSDSESTEPPDVGENSDREIQE